MLQWWDRIPLGGPVNVKTMLREWFFRPASYGEYLSGDWSMDMDGEYFESHVRCVVLDEIAQLDCRTLSPERDSYFLFYAEQRGYLVIWGGLTFQDLFALNPPGVVRRDQDLLWQPASKTRCRSLAAPTSAKMEKRDVVFDKAAWSALWFPLPVADCVDPDQHLTAEVFEVALGRLQWYYSDESAGPFPVGHLEQGAFLLCATLVGVFQNQSRETALEYQLRRLERERWLFDQRVAPFLGSEKGMLSLLKHNARFWTTHFINRVVAPDPEDEQALYRLDPNISTTVWISIPVWEAPCFGMNFPLHEGGCIHIPCHPPWLAIWIWHSCILPEMQRNFTNARPPPEHGVFGEFFQEALVCQREAVERFRARQEAKTRKSSPKSYDGSKWEKGSGPPLIGDMEDLFRAAPPCVTSLITQRRFPINMERLGLTGILIGAGVSMAVIVQLYERLNQQYIRDHPQTLSKRFDVEGTAKWWSKRDPVWCTALIKASISGSQGMQCPLVFRETDALGPPPTPAIFKDDAAMAKYSYQVRQRCGACHTPGRPDHWKPWSSPEQAMREGFKRNQGNL